MKGKFSNETAERLYEEWTDGRHDGECCDGQYWYVLFADGDNGTGHILTECEFGFVEAREYPNDEIAEVWGRCVAGCEEWESGEVLA